MLFYLLINLGALAGQLGMVYAEKNIGEFPGAFCSHGCTDPRSATEKGVRAS